MTSPKSLMEYVCEAIDEALPPGAGLTGRYIYMQGFERYEAARHAEDMKRKRRELEAALPLLAPGRSGGEVIEDFSVYAD